MHAGRQLVGPRPPLVAPHREVVVLEQEDAHAVLAMEKLHFLDDLVRPAHAHDLARRRAVEGVDRAERTAPDAAAAGQHRQRREPGDPLGAVRAQRERQGVEVVDEGARRRRHDLAVACVGDAADGTPVLARLQAIGELDQRLFAFVAHHAVDLGEVGQQLVMAQARIVTADGEVGGDADAAQMGGDAAELGQEELEDQREAHHQRRPLEKSRGDFRAAVANVDHFRLVAVPLQHGRQISHAEVALVLIADQGNSRRRGLTDAPPRAGRVRPARANGDHGASLDESGGFACALGHHPEDFALRLEPERGDLLGKARIDLEDIFHVDPVTDRGRTPQDRRTQFADL